MGGTESEKPWNAMKASTLELCEYIVKCLVGVTIGYVLYKAFPQYSGEFFWMLLSILLSITHDNSSKVAFDRMKGNIVGSIVGFLAFLLRNPPNLRTISLGIVLTITLCFLFRLIEVSRTALVAFIIVVIHEEERSSWDVAAYRMASVISGCLIGLIINYVFRRITSKLFRAVFPPATQAADGSNADGGE